VKNIHLLLSTLLLFACGGDEETDELCGVDSVVVSLISATSASCGEANGSFEVTATGQGSITYSLDGVNFQVSGEFSNLKPEQYVVTARDEKDCRGTGDVLVESSDEISFSQTIKPIIETTCAVTDCHIAGEQTPDLSMESNIFSAAPRIKRQVETRAMPFGEDRTLRDEQIEEIICWFVNGAKDN